MLESQAPLDIAQLLSVIGKIQQENQQMEAELQQMTVRRDHLVSVNARLSLPSTAPTTPADHQRVAASISTTAAVSGAPPKYHSSQPSVLTNG